MTAILAIATAALNMTGDRPPQNTDGLYARKVLRGYSGQWSVPQPYGPDGWWLDSKQGSRVIMSCAAMDDGVEWVHASMSCHDRVPTYEELTWLREAVFRGGWAYQVFAPPSGHVNDHEFVLHLWGRLDGRPVLPEFNSFTGTI